MGMEHENEHERWLPIGFKFGPNAASVRWMDFGADPLTEPFFGQTVRKLKAATPAARERTSDLKVFMTMAARFSPLLPTGVIFHVSRCGSSLIANALRAGEGVTVLSEARPIGSLIRPELFRRLPFPAESADDIVKALLDSTVRLYGRTHGVNEPKVVIKCHAASLLHIPWMRAMWPTVPFLVVIRDPIEVIVSNLEKAASWAKAWNRPMVASKLFGWPVEEVRSMSREEYSARAMGRFCEIAHGSIGESCWVVDYEHLDLWTLYSIAHFFGIDLPPRDSAAVENLLSTYAKDPKRERKFEDDRERKRQKATQAVREAALRWAYDPYRRLKAMERPQFAPCGDAV